MTAMTCRRDHRDGRFRTRLRVGRLLLLAFIAFMVRLVAFAFSQTFTAFVPSKFKVAPPDAKHAKRSLRATLSEAVVDETGFETEQPVLKSQGPPSGPGDVKKVNIDRLGERILADYSIGTAQTLPLRGVLGGSVYARSLRKQLISCSKDARSVIIFGEPGTKKDMLAFLIHFHRRKGQLLFVDSGTVSSLGVRIFGRPKVDGLLDLDKEGTLIFNNVHRLNKQLLPALVELAQNGTYWSRKFQETRKSKLKIILIAEDQFEELSSIKAAVRIKVPALRVRRADIESMVKYQLRILSRTYGKQVPRVEPEALKRLQAYDYPNNVQELFSLIDNAWAHLSDGSSLTAEMLWTAQSPSKLDTFKVNLLDVYPGLRKFLQSNWLERLNHGFTKYVFAALVILLFIGPQSRDANFGLNIFWAWWWPGILLTYPVLGRFWCAVCPFMIYGEIVQRWRIADGAVMQKWPQSVEKYGAWFLYVLFFGILMWEELWVLEDTAYLSSCLLLLITLGAMVGSWFFERRIWCRHLCPIGGMNGLYAKLAVTELRAQNGQCKAVCNTFHCYKGGPAEGEGQETDGCPLYSHPANLKDNKNCVLCFTCLRACPHRNVQLNLRAPGVDFGFPFLFPIPGTKTAAQHDPSFPELALLFLLLGAVFCHHLEDMVLQFGQSPNVLANFESHALIACLALLFPGVLVYAADRLMRQLCTIFTQDRIPPNDFLQLAYSYLPLTWLASLAAPKPALAPFSGRMLIQIGNCLTQLGAKHPSRFMDVYQEQIAIAIPSLSQEDCELVTPCLAASPLLPDALRRAFLERCAEVDAGAPLVAPEASATPEIARYQRDAEVYRRRAKHLRNIFMIEASIRKETWAFFSSLPAEVRSYLDRVHERSKELKHPKPLGFAAEVATVLDQLGVPTWSTMAGPLEVHLVQANTPGVEAEDVVYECNEAEAYCAMRQEDRTPQLTMATKFRHKLLQRLGLQLVHINYWEWSRLSEAQRINYMVKLQARQVG